RRRPSRRRRTFSGPGGIESDDASLHRAGSGAPSRGICCKSGVRRRGCGARRPRGRKRGDETVGAGPPLTKPPPGVPEYGDATQFFPKTVTVHAGDTVRWKFFGFHNIYLPKKGGRNIPLLVPDRSRTYAGEVDPVGQPFWFNGQRELVGNPNVAFPL